MERANLTARFPVAPGRCQVVFCRNVLIYLSRSAAEPFLDRLADWLAPDGLVFLGYAEAVLAPTPRLRVQRLGPAHALRVVPGTAPGSVPGADPGGLWTTASPEPGRGLTLPHRGTRHRVARVEAAHGTADSVGGGVAAHHGGGDGAGWRARGSPGEPR